MRLEKVLQGRPHSAIRQGTGTRFPYCFRCLMINKLDVMAPYWKAAWIGVNAADCALHLQRGTCVTVETLRRERNLWEVVRYISRRQRRYRQYVESPHQRRLRTC